MQRSTSPRPAHFTRLALFFLTALAAFALLGFGARQAQASTTYYVATTGSNFNTGLSWSSPKSNLQSTITAAHLGDQVWVEKGTYTGNFTATDGVAVYGGFAGTETSTNQRVFQNGVLVNITVLDGNQAGTVYTIPSSATGTNTLDGFTVENGTSNGGLYDASSRDTLNVANCMFQSDAGGIRASSATTTFSNCSFTSNTSSGISVSGTTSISSCTFSENTRSGISATGATTTVSDCTFNGNSATSGGGVNASGTLTVRDSTFTSNTATSDEYGDGGGIYAVGASTSINGCTFMNNEANAGGFYTGGGGAIEARGVLTLSECVFANNSTSGGNGASGGGVCADGSTTNINECTFTGNSINAFPGSSTIEGSGGGIYANGLPTITDCTFGGSSASDANTPEAISLRGVGNTSTPALVKDNLITGMGTATTDADGIDTDTGGGTSYIAIANNTIVNTNVGINLATTGGAISIANNVFEGDDGSLNTTGSPGPTFTSSHNDNYGNVSYYYQGLNPSPSDLTVNPIFVNAEGGDYELASTSPLINAGDDSYVMSGDLDLDGNPRIYGSHVDVGAYEYTPSGTPVPASIAFDPASVASGAQTTATVTLTLPAPAGGAVVALTSSNTAAAPVPSSVTVAAGATTATFKITTGTVTANTNVTITASLNGNSVTGTLTVAPQSIKSLTLSSYTITGGDAITGQVTLTYPAMTSTVVTLAPGGSDSVPASVTIPANGTTATFTIETSAVPAKIGASVTATLSGKATKTGFTLLPPQVATLVLAPDAVMGGTPTVANISMNVPAPSGGIVVHLTSSNTNAAAVPTSVTIPAGASFMSVPVTTYAVSGYTKVTISAITTALTGAAPLTLLP